MSRGDILYSVAMCEVQDDVVAMESDICMTREEAKARAMEFMLERVGDFLDIDDNSTARKCALDANMTIESVVFKGMEKTVYLYRIDGLCVSAAIQASRVARGT